MTYKEFLLSFAEVVGRVSPRSSYMCILLNIRQYYNQTAEESVNMAPLRVWAEHMRELDRHIRRIEAAEAQSFAQHLTAKYDPTLNAKIGVLWHEGVQILRVRWLHELADSLEEVK